MTQKIFPSSIQNSSDIRVSFEFFPPKTPDLEQKLWETIHSLQAFGPHFVSVTYGAGGSTRDKTFEIVTSIQQKTGLRAASHFTCVESTQEDSDEQLHKFWASGIRHIVALRGDPPAGQKQYTPYPGGYPYAADLIAGIKKIANFEISAAAYPETHPEALSPAADFDNLKHKVDAGADRLITQFFFDPELYLRLHDKVDKAGIKVPLVPGILPIANFTQMMKFAKMCGASVPTWIIELYEKIDVHSEMHKMLSAIIASEQCRILYANGVRQFHIYTLNHADLAEAICRSLGIKPHPLPLREKTC